MKRLAITTIAVPTPFPVGPVNVHVIRRDPVTLVDAGPATPEAWNALLKGLASLGLEPRDVKRVLLTHGHHDHFGLARRLADAGAEVAGGRLDGRAFRMQRGSPGLLKDLARSGFGVRHRFRVVLSGALIDRVAEPLVDFRPLGGGEVFTGDDFQIRVLAAPGHTAGSLAFEVPEARTLFTGDTVLDRITPNAVVAEHPEKRGNLFIGLARYLESLESLRSSARGKILLTGHGAPVASLDVRLVDVKRRYRAREASIVQHLSEYPRTVRELVRVLFPRLDAMNLYLAYSEVRGFLSVLEGRGRVRHDADGALDRWSRAA